MVAEKREMDTISQYAGQRKDYVQGGGGNTSVKLDEKLMAIKASGYTLSDVTTDAGYVTVNYQKIREYYETVDLDAAKDYEKESLSVNMDSIVLLDGMEKKRPSVEVGFHAFLKKYVIHTHSVYANILCCSEEGKAVAQKIFAGGSVRYLFIPYINPGFRLTLKIGEALNNYTAQNGISPEAIFMENHGLIVHGDDCLSTIQVHEKVNALIRAYFNISEYPKPRIIETPELIQSESDFIRQFIVQNRANELYFGALKLYPDLLVYTNDKFGNTIQIKNDTISYNANVKEAQTIEETLLAAVFVVNAIQGAGLTLRQMDKRSADFINNWESEKYRANQLKGESS